MAGVVPMKGLRRGIAAQQLALGMVQARPRPLEQRGEFGVHADGVGFGDLVLVAALQQGAKIVALVIGHIHDAATQSDQNPMQP